MKLGSSNFVGISVPYPQGKVVNITKVDLERSYKDNNTLILLGQLKATWFTNKLLQIRAFVCYVMWSWYKPVSKESVGSNFFTYKDGGN
jgi:hypothetical protein